MDVIEAEASTTTTLGLDSLPCTVLEARQLRPIRRDVETVVVAFLASLEYGVPHFFVPKLI